MNILEKYQRALDLYKAKKFSAALDFVDELKILAPDWKKTFLLEAYIRREQGAYLEEFSLLSELLPRFDFKKPDEKILAAEALSLFGAVNRELGKIPEAVESFKLSAMLEGVGDKACAEISNALFAANAYENFSAEDFRELYAEYKKYSADVVPFARKFYRHEKIRVGFISADFCWHVVMAWSWALLTELNKNFFETYCYSAGKDSDSVTKHLRGVADCWRDISELNDLDAAKIIRADEIDILLDLSGHTSGNRLRVVKYHPASVQISGIGYMNSTGLEAVDYFLSDIYCAGNENYFVEKILRLPRSHICFETPIKLEVAAPPCIKNNFVTFGSFNQFAKVTDSILRAWKKILDAVPKSRLILKHKIFNTDDGKNFVSERLKNFGFDLARIEMRPYTANHAAAYNDIDIALDTFPYTGGVTTCEALYMGVPVISIYGDRHGSRFGLSILANVGLAELAVDNFDAYIARAVMLAGDWELLRLLRKNLRGMLKKSPLMNSEIYIRDIEAALIKIFHQRF